MIDHEAIYQLMMKEEWPEIIKILHTNKSVILEEPTLMHAAKTFEDIFLKKVDVFPLDDDKINHTLQLLYVLHFGNFYQLTDDNLKRLIVTLVRRTGLKEAYNYAKHFPNEMVCQQTIERYQKELLAAEADTQKTNVSNINWVEVFNRLFELINNQGDTATYFSGPRFLDAVREILPYYLTYSQYIQQRNLDGKSTSRKIFYYDILMELDVPVRKKIIEKILMIVKPFAPEKVWAIGMVMGKESINQDILESTETIKAKRTNPVVFISYSWDDEPHKEWVLELAGKLTNDGIQVLLDRYSLKPGRNLPHFVERSISEADRVLIIFTPNYKLKADKRTGGVGYEYSIMNAELYQNQTKNEKIIPILRSGEMVESIPTFMHQFIHLDLRNDQKFENSYSDLLREIYDEPVIKLPFVGSKPNFK